MPPRPRAHWCTCTSSPFPLHALHDTSVDVPHCTCKLAHWLDAIILHVPGRWSLKYNITAGALPAALYMLVFEARLLHLPVPRSRSLVRVLYRLVARQGSETCRLCFGMPQAPGMEVAGTGACTGTGTVPSCDEPMPAVWTASSLIVSLPVKKAGSSTCRRQLTDHCREERGRILSGAAGVSLISTAERGIRRLERLPWLAC